MRVPAVRVCALAVVLAASACAGRSAAPGAGAPIGTDEAAAREVVSRFARALEAGRFEEAHALLSSRWRAAYTPARLALDFRGAGPAARDATARVLAALPAGGRLEPAGAGARLLVEGGHAAALVVEDGRWRVDELE